MEEFWYAGYRSNGGEYIPLIGPFPSDEQAEEHTNMAAELMLEEAMATADAMVKQQGKKLPSPTLRKVIGTASLMRNGAFGVFQAKECLGPGRYGTGVVDKAMVN